MANRGTIATCNGRSSSPVSAACHLLISSLASRMASSSDVINGSAGLRADGLDAPAADDPQSAALRLGEQRILGMGKRGPEDHGSRGAAGDPPVAELDRRPLREVRDRRSGLRRGRCSGSAIPAAAHHRTSRPQTSAGNARGYPRTREQKPGPVIGHRCRLGTSAGRRRGHHRTRSCRRPRQPARLPELTPMRGRLRSPAESRQGEKCVRDESEPRDLP